MTDIMIDLETMGTGTFAPIIEIGAVAFDRNTGEISYEFHKPVGLESSLAAGAKVDAATIGWWMNQDDAARVNAMRAIASRSGLVEVLTDLRTWFGAKAAPSGEACVWSHGATFDIRLLVHWFAVAGIDVPWHFTRERDTRTLFDIAGYRPADDPLCGPVAHRALDDARAQAGMVARAFARTRLVVAP